MINPITPEIPPILHAGDYPLPGSIGRPAYESGEREALIEEITRLLGEKDAVLVAHYYTDEDLQLIADRTGGMVADSLEMARFGTG